MSLMFPPQLGLVVICDYSTGFREPEMVKERLAVVVSKRLPHRDGLCTVVPLSTTPSRHGIRYQCKVDLPFEAPAPYAGSVKWAKADMLATLCYNRMSLPYEGKDHTGKRKYLKMILNPVELAKIRVAMLHALDLETLAHHLSAS
jgi:mRNA interferase MazF